MALTNEDATNPNKIILFYLKNIVVTGIGSNIAPTWPNALTYRIGNLGLYFVEGLMNNPVN
jgi:hypothetical protein